MIKEAIKNLVSGRSLDTEEAAAVMDEIMEGKATPSQLGAFLVALKIKGETADEIAGFARTMQGKATPVFTPEDTVDIVGTGGDEAGTFNISTTSAFVAAGAGLKIAKHGNRAASSRCGSADVLEALGVRIKLSPAEVSACIEKVGIGFMFAQAFHPAMKHAAPTRQEIGIPTTFNILGPLTNPARPRAILLGVSEEKLVEKMAIVLKNLGCPSGMIVHGEDGLDEITVSGRTLAAVLKNGDIKTYSITPEEFGLKRASIEDLRGGTAEENAAITISILSGAQGPKKDIVLLNSAAALAVGGKVDTIEEGLALAQDSIDSGRALEKLKALISLSRSFGHDA